MFRRPSGTTPTWWTARPTTDNYLTDAGINEKATTTATINPEDYKGALTENPDAAFIMTTGARQPVYFHSEHRQLPWCRELWPSPRFEMNPNDAARLGIEQGDWIWVRTPWGAIREVADLYYGIKEGTTNANHAWWYPEMDHAAHGFELVGINCTMDKYAECWVCGAPSCARQPVVICAATARTARSATRSVRSAGQPGHRQRRRPASEGMAGQRPASGRTSQGRTTYATGLQRSIRTRAMPGPRAPAAGECWRRCLGQYSKHVN